MKPTHYTPRRLAAVPPPDPQREGEQTYSLYILPADPAELTAEDLSRFPSVPLGDEAAARAFLDRTGEAPIPERPRAPEEKRKRRRQFLGDILFYLALTVFVLGVFLFRGSGDGAPATFMGFSAMRVLTGSMQSVIPQGSLIITRSVDPATLEIGDDITYLAGVDTTVTHRVVGITENYAGTGARAFTTQGVMNESPDHLLVPAANVVGKVIFHNLALGKILHFVRQYWTWLLVLLVLTLGLCKSLRIVFRESETEQTGDGQAPKRLAVPAGRKGSRLKT